MLKIDSLSTRLLPDLEGKEVVLILSVTTSTSTEVAGIFKSENSMKRCINDLFLEKFELIDGEVYPQFKYSQEPLL